MGTKGVDVLDGEYLLHKVYWDRNERFSDIFAKYVRYMQQNHSGNAVVVLDGYTEYNQKTIKSSASIRRLKIHTSAEVQINETMFP